MRITEIRVYAHPSRRTGSYNMSAGAVTDVDSTLVQVVSDRGLHGWGEVCVSGPIFQPDSTETIRAALSLLAPAVVGLDPRRHGIVNAAMTAAMLGTPRAKAAIDIACWDLTGKACGERICDLMGGPRMDPVLTYHVVGIGAPTDAAAQAQELLDAGITKIQLKAGGRHIDQDIGSIRAVAGVMRPGTDLFVDVNRGWTVGQAIAVSNACADVSFDLEQPCETLAECAAAKPSLRHPLLIDESATDLATISQAISAGVANGLGMKLTRIGGLTAMRAVRDLCAATHTPSSCDDSWGGDIIAAACVQLGSTFDPPLSRGAWIADPYIEGHYDPEHGPRIIDGKIPLPPGPGLGITISDGLFGDPIAVYA